jgi:hypothetical protein
MSGERIEQEKCWLIATLFLSMIAVWSEGQREDQAQEKKQCSNIAG